MNHPSDLVLAAPSTRYLTGTVCTGVHSVEIPALNSRGEVHRRLASQRPGFQVILHWVTLLIPNMVCSNPGETEAPSPRALKLCGSEKTAKQVKRELSVTRSC